MGDPVEAEGEVAEPEQPAAREGGAAVGGGFDQPEEQREAGESDGPELERFEAGCGNETEMLSPEAVLFRTPATPSIDAVVAGRARTFFNSRFLPGGPGTIA